jgi:hypothetical protein
MRYKVLVKISLAIAADQFITIDEDKASAAEAMRNSGTIEAWCERSS